MSNIFIYIWPYFVEMIIINIKAVKIKPNIKLTFSNEQILHQFTNHLFEHKKICLQEEEEEKKNTLSI